MATETIPPLSRRLVSYAASLPARGSAWSLIQEAIAVAAAAEGEASADAAVASARRRLGLARDAGDAADELLPAKVGA